MINKISNVKRLALLMALAIFLVALVVVFPAVVFAQQPRNLSIITMPWPEKDLAKRPVPPPFILPRQSRWGCLSCHSSKKLTKFENGKEVSRYINPNIIGNSMHKKIACLDCHTNFSYETHPASSPKDFRKVAGLACMRCHPYQAYLYKKSIHGQLALQNKLGTLNGKKVAPPTCRDCHGFHNIQSPRFEPYRSKFINRLRQGKLCAKCHKDRYNSWNDYYHGLGFKNGAKDAPTCWDCHNNHEILPVSDPNSTVNSDNLPKTCGRCHDRPTKVFTGYAPMIHGRQKLLSENLVGRIISIFVPSIRQAQPGVKLAKKRTAKPSAKKVKILKPKKVGFLSRIYRFFFPASLRQRK